MLVLARIVSFALIFNLISTNMAKSKSFPLLSRGASAES
jgi:hypothetical protein